MARYRVGGRVSSDGCHPSSMEPGFMGVVFGFRTPFNGRRVLFDMLVHAACKGEVLGGEERFCDICGRSVEPAECLVVDDSPSPFSG